MYFRLVILFLTFLIFEMVQLLLENPLSLKSVYELLQLDWLVVFIEGKARRLGDDLHLLHLVLVLEGDPLLGVLRVVEDPSSHRFVKENTLRFPFVDVVQKVELLLVASVVIIVRGAVVQHVKPVFR